MAKILIVDDNLEDRGLLAHLLAQRGHDIREAIGCADALVMASVEQPDLVISGVLMSAMEAADFIGRLPSTVGRTTPVIFRAANLDCAVDLARDCGAEFFLAKPIDPAALLHAVDICLKDAKLQSPPGRLKAPEAAQRISDARYQLYFANNPLPGWLYDTRSLRFLDVNVAATKHYGYSREEFLTMTIDQIRSPEDVSAELHRLAGAAVIVPNQSRARHRRKNGTQVDVEILSHFLDGVQPVRFVLIHDVTERRRNETLTREASEYLNMALEASHTGVWTWDALGDRVVLDTNTHRIFGLIPGSFGGTLGDLLATLHPEDQQILSNSLSGTTPNRPELAPEFRVIWPDGSLHHVACRGQGFFGDGGVVIRVSGVSHDISEQRLLEEKFRQTHKMEAVGQLAAGIAHDFNNVLTVIIGYCSLLIANPQREGSIQKALQEMLDAAQRAATLTGQLLAFSKRQVLQPQVIDLRTTLRDIDQLVGWTLGEKIEVAIITGQDPANVRIDPNQIQQVILNLVVNARDAMRRGGNLTLEIKNVELSEIQASEHDVPAGEYVLLVVSDTGVGMTPDVQQHAFEPFFTTKEKGSGTGLGLASVYGIVRQSGGCILLNSTPEIGTTFSIFFPRLEELAETPPHRPALTLRGGNETILVIEDDAEVRGLVQEILRSVGYHIIVATDGEVALRLANEYAGDIRLLVTDVVMQKMGGRECAERLAAIRPTMKVLYMSGYTGDDVLRLGILDHDVDYLPKPFTALALCAKIRLILDSDAVLHRVLVVDQERSIRALLSAILEDNGFQVITAQDPHEAIEKGESHPVDLVIADLGMPVEDGIQMISQLRKENEQFRIIGMSGAFGSDVIDAAEKIGAHATLSKPLTPAMVLQCIDGVKQAIS